MIEPWEHDGGYPPDNVGFEASSFATLITHYSGYRSALNILVDWQWNQADDEGPEHFALYMFMPRKNLYVSWTCPIHPSQSAAVRSWLESEAEVRRNGWLT